MGLWMLASSAAVLLGVLLLPGLAVRPSQQNLWPLEVADSQPLLFNAQERNASTEFHTDKSSILEAEQADASVTEKTWDDYWLATSAVYPKCPLLTEGNLSIDEPLHVNDSCIWHANGVQVTVKQPMKFHGSLMLQGELHIIGGAQLDVPCMTVLGNLSTLGTRMTFTGCENTNKTYEATQGGGLHVGGDFWLLRSTATFVRCKAGHGGGADVTGRFEQRNSSANFEGCSAGLGGGLQAKNFTQMQNSSAQFDNCTAKYYGGGAYVSGHFEQRNSSANFEGCSAGYHGGGAFVYSHFEQRNSSANFEGCSAGYNGGGLRAGNFNQDQGAVAEFDNCSAKLGGGIRVEKVSQDSASSLHFEKCTAAQGGGLLVQKELTGNGSTLFRTCQAEEGGGLNVVFEECSASNEGGGLYLRARSGDFKNLSFQRYKADTLAAALAAGASGVEVRIKELALLDGGASDVKDITASGTLTIGNAHLHTSSKFGTYISARSLVLAEETDCTGTTYCAFYADEVQPPGLRCPVGTGLVPHDRLHKFGCLVCDPGKTQTINGSNRSCSDCPSGARECFAKHLVMAAGHMVEMDNITHTIFCPAKASCPGGRLGEGKPKAMCAEGYKGAGCTECGSGYAMADTSVLTCTRCSDEPHMQVMQWVVLLTQRSVIFAVACASVMGANTASSSKQSSVYINQFMAFATIATAVLTAVLQTADAQGMKTTAVNYLFNAAVAAAETGSGQGSLSSTQCLLSYINFESLWGAHALEVALAFLLVLCARSRAGVVAGLNCFLPSIAAGFGKYIVCFRLQPDDGSLTGLRCPFLPGDSSVPVSVAKVLGGLLLCLTAALWTWLHMCRSTEEPPPSHVLWLVGKYKESYKFFETERLLRKTAITFIGGVLPIAASPALQMGFLGLIVLTSLGLYVVCQPYQNHSCNRTEINLLFMAAYMIIMVATLLANEFHWAHSGRMQQAIIVTTTLCAGVTSTVMGCFVVAESLKERKAEID